MEHMDQAQLENFIQEGEAMVEACDAALGAELDAMASMELTPIQRERILMVLDKFTAVFDRAKKIIESKK